MSKQISINTTALGYGVKAHLAEVVTVNGQASPSFAVCGMSLRSVMHNLKPATSSLEMPATDDYIVVNAVRLNAYTEIMALVASGDLDVCERCEKSMNRLVGFLAKQQKAGA